MSRKLQYAMWIVLAGLSIGALAGCENCPLWPQEDDKELTTTDTGVRTTVTEQPAARMAAQQGNPDALFTTLAGQSSAGEIELGRLAEQRASDPRVKDVAQQMVQDHQAITRDLDRAASQAGIRSVPKEPSSTQELVADSLKDMRGRTFDTEYLGQMVASHERSVAMYEHASQHAQSSSIRQFASQQLPRLREHLDQVRSLHDSLGATAVLTPD